MAEPTSSTTSDPPAPPPQAQPTTTTTTAPLLHTSTPFLPYPFTTTTPAPTLVAQGAEALLYRTTYLTSTTPAALKVRPSKKYRHRTLDERLTKQRVLAEARVLVKLSSVAGREAQGWNVPQVWGVEWDVGRKVRGLGQEARVRVEDEGGHSGEGKGAWLLMEWIEGRSVKDLVRGWDLWMRDGEVGEEEKREAEEELKGLFRRIGKAVGGMHARGGVVHGDLTSSNIIVRRVGGRAVKSGEGVGVDEAGEGRAQRPDLSGEVVLIDFGLATQSVQDEDRAVDLYVLERAFGSTHPRQEESFSQELLHGQDAYSSVWKGAATVLRRLEEVRMRGRKRSMIG